MHRATTILGQLQPHMSASSNLPPVASLAGLNLDSFQALLGGIYEESPWVSQAVHKLSQTDATIFNSLTALAAAMKQIVDNAPREQQLALLRAHPDLAGKAALAGKLTASSTEEQKRAGLASLTQQELVQLTEMNSTYTKKMGHPFILAVRNASKATILGALKGRVQNSPTVEFAACLAQVHKIAWMRLLTTVTPAPTGFLTCHVLDTARGCPAGGMCVTLHRLVDGEQWELVADLVTNADGRLPNGPVLKGEGFRVGQYEWRFQAGDYFAMVNLPTAGLPFLGEIPIRFGIDNPEAHYHVPLLVSPYSFSTYRGS